MRWRAHACRLAGHARMLAARPHLRPRIHVRGRAHCERRCQKQHACYIRQHPSTRPVPRAPALVLVLLVCRVHAGPALVRAGRRHKQGAEESTEAPAAGDVGDDIGQPEVPGLGTQQTVVEGVAEVREWARGIVAVEAAGAVVRVHQLGGQAPERANVWVVAHLRDIVEHIRVGDGVARRERRERRGGRRKAQVGPNVGAAHPGITAGGGSGCAAARRRSPLCGAVGG